MFYSHFFFVKLDVVKFLIILGRDKVVPKSAKLDPNLI
jgi:hypothetical protein